jgi:hypothetical protein
MAKAIFTLEELRHQENEKVMIREFCIELDSYKDVMTQ